MRPRNQQFGSVGLMNQKRNCRGGDMNNKDTSNLIDEVEFTIRDKTGRIKKHYTSNTRWNRLLKKLHLKQRNCITKYGMAETAALLVLDVGGTAFDYVAIGEGVTAPTVNNQTLESELKRKASTGTRIQTTQVNDTAKWTASFSSADGLSGEDNVSEVGVLNADENGTLLTRLTFTPQTLDWDDGDTFEISVKVQIKQGS